MGGERLAFLRRRIAAIEARGWPAAAPPPQPSPASREREQIPHFIDVTRNACRPLSREAGEGWGGGRSDLSFVEAEPYELLLQGLIAGDFGELVPARPRDAGAAAGFACALALSAEALRRRGVVWIVEDMAAREIGLPYGVGLKALGLDPARLVLVRTRGGPETLAAMEEALKSRAAATIAESWIAPSAYDLKASRRLLLAQRRGGGLGLLLLLRAGGEAQRLTSAAPVRVEIAAPALLPAERPPPPAPPLWRLRVAKARAGGRGGAFDPLVWRGVAFHPDKAELHAFRERVPALSADRPAPARRAFA